MNYQDEAYADVENSLTLDSRTLVNFRGGYETERWGVYGYLFNAFDETYAVTAAMNFDGRLIGKVGAPREYGVQFKAWF